MHLVGFTIEVQYLSLVSHFYTIYNFSCIKVYERPEDGSHLEPKHVAVNKRIKLVLCVTDLIHTHTCDLLTLMRMSHLKKQNL